MLLKYCKTILFAVVPILFGLHIFVLKHAHIESTIVLLDSSISTSLITLATLEIYLLLKYFPPKWSNLATVLGIIGILVFTQCTLVKTIFSFLDTDYHNFIQKTIFLRCAFVFLYLSLMAVVIYLWQQTQVFEVEENRQLAIEKMNKEAELYKLRHQLQPHFLFNSLNSISALAGSRPQEARLMIQQLSDFLRITLKKEEQDLVTLGEELQHLDLYLAIEKVRFGHRLITEIEVDEKSLNFKIPSMILQPIVENAIKFGLYDTLDETVIKIKADFDSQSNLKIQVENPFDFQTAVPQKGNGFGLKSIKRRLYLIYARNDLLHTSKEENKFITNLSIPPQKND